MKLDSQARKTMPKSEFAIPAQKKYPINDKIHAQLAKGRATQMFNKGKLSASERAKIHAKADRVLGKTFHSHKGI